MPSDPPEPTLPDHPPGPGARRSERVRWRARDLATSAVQRSWRAVVQLGKVRSGSTEARRFGAFGEGSSIAFPPGDLIGPEAVHIGRRSALGADVSLAAGFPGQRFQEGCPPVISIGDRVTIGRGSFLVALVGLVVEDDVTIAPHVYLTDHNHTYADLEVPIGEQWPEAAETVIGAGSWLGTGVIVLAGSRIGRHVVVAGGSVVRGDIPDHSVVAGVPAKVVRRWTEADGWVPPLPRQVEVPDGWPAGTPPPDVPAGR